MITISNGGKVAFKDIPILPLSEFRDYIIQEIKQHGRISSLFGWRENDKVWLMGILATCSGLIAVVLTNVSERYPALTPDCPQAHWFEREIWEQTGVIPEGHPWLKPIRYAKGEIGVTGFFQIKGGEVHEVAVGPVHAGIIEPGHFRFLCHGEHVMHLEISLGYQHRGIEACLRNGPNRRTIHYMETAAGDTTIGHATAYAMIMESLTDIKPPLRALSLRGITLELERIANHIGDLGALAGDIGYLPTASYCGRLRGDFLNLTGLICGNRFGRGMIRPGGTGFDVDADLAKLLNERLQLAMQDVSQAVNLLWDSPSVMGRFETTGRLTRQMCENLGLVGPAARACGLEQDVRVDFPFDIYRFLQIPISTCPSGDVLARAQVRWLEIQRSAEFIKDRLQLLPEGDIIVPISHPACGTLAVSLVEGWRGETCHTAITDKNGRFSVYKIVDPSFHNWMGLAMAMREQEISDFPLCNKSFNLSYCGHDL